MAYNNSRAACLTSLLLLSSACLANTSASSAQEVDTRGNTLAKHFNRCTKCLMFFNYLLLGYTNCSTNNPPPSSSLPNYSTTYSLYSLILELLSPNLSTRIVMSWVVSGWYNLYCLANNLNQSDNPCTTTDTTLSPKSI